MAGEEKLELEVTADTRAAIKGLKKIDNAVNKNAKATARAMKSNLRAEEQIRKKSAAGIAKLAKSRAQSMKINHRAAMQIRKKEATALAAANKSKLRAEKRHDRAVRRMRKRRVRELKKLAAARQRQIASIKRVAKYAAIAGAAIAVMFTKKVITDAVDFQSAVLKMRTMLDITGDQVGELNERLEEQAKAWGIPAMDQAAAGYKIASGVTKDLDEAMKFLTATNKLAVVGFDRLEGSTATTIKVMRAAGFDFGRVDEITKKLWATVRSGILETAELEGAMGKLGTAFAFVPFEQVAAAYSVLTTKLGGTEEAATALNKLILALTSTTSKGARAAKEQGIEFGIVALQQKGFIGILKELDALHDRDIAAWKATFPELRAFRGAVGLTGDSLVEMGDNLSTFDEKMVLFDKLLVEVMNSTRKELDRTKAAWRDVWRDIGEEILPGLTDLVRDDLLPILREWGEWVKDNKDEIKGFFDDIATSAGALVDTLRALKKLGQFFDPYPEGFPELAPINPTLAEQVGSEVGEAITPEQIAKARGIRNMTVNLAPTYVQTKDPQERLTGPREFTEEVTAR